MFNSIIVLRRTDTYYMTYYDVLYDVVSDAVRLTTTYHDVLRRITKYYDVLRLRQKSLTKKRSVIEHSMPLARRMHL